jgi:alpha-tubulin suppressor-like RCC1 family protein
MAVICKATLDTCLQTSINAVNTSSNAESILIAAVGLPSANSIANYVSTCASLPNLGTWDLEGQLTMVCNVPVFATHKSWVGLDGRSLRQDCFDIQLWAAGCGTGGQLATNSTTNRCSFVQEVTSSTDWSTISTSLGPATAYGVHHGGIKKDGTLWMWGCNNCGQVGDGTATTRSSPVREFYSATNWCSIGMGGNHSHAIKTDGSLWSWGRNYYGSLGIGIGTSGSCCSPVREFCSATNWSRVSGGTIFSVALKTDGTVWGWGRNNAGQVGDGFTSTRCSPVQEKCSATNWCQISAGCVNAAALKTDGTLWSWGCGGSGAIGDGFATNRCSAIQEFCSATNWCAVSAAGTTGSAALKTDGSLWAWGLNSSGRLGVGNTTASCSPVRELCNATNWCKLDSGQHSMGAVKTDGSLWAWGANYYGMLATGNTTAVCSPVREFYSATNWCDISMGFKVGFALRAV